MRPPVLPLLCAWLAASLPLPAQQLSPLARAPDWGDLEPYQETITRADFTSLLETVYAPQNAAAGWIDIGPEAAIIRTGPEPDSTFSLRFAPDAAHARPIPRYWRPVAELPPAPDPAQPLAGVKIAIDPGHLGGEWARMEERWFQIGQDTVPVAEGDLTLRVAQLAARRLRALGAEILPVRDKAEPVTAERPETLREAARAELAAEGRVNVPETYSGPDDPSRGGTVQFHSEKLFYRTAEIRERARLVNTTLQPDLVLCLHFDADAWGDPGQPLFTPFNRLHALVNGTYSATELSMDDVRHDMLLKLLQRCAGEELAANNAIVRVLARRMALPPYVYNSAAASRPGPSPYVWARNLLANRLYQCPVVFLEPYAMNSREVWERVQAGDYEGERIVAGSLRPSLFREYANALCEGVEAYFQNARPNARP